ncbi:MAG: YlbF family regulator [Firmicutes bacterium]|nr:YlbF family regulator [Bacillota bacterium]
MSVYDQAHALARALKSCDEYTSFLAAKAKVDADKNAKKMLRDFQQRQIAVQKAQMLNEEVPEEQIKQLERMFEVLSYNPIIKEYLTAEFRLARMLADIQKIIGEAVELGLDEED